VRHFDVSAFAVKSSTFEFHSVIFAVVTASGMVTAIATKFPVADKTLFQRALTSRLGAIGKGSLLSIRRAIKAEHKDGCGRNRKAFYVMSRHRRS
jgi:hypothetical protein